MRSTLMVLAVMTGAASITSAAALDIRHEPVTCVPTDSYARVVATASPGASAARADLQFRVDPGGGWYSIAMTSEGAGWIGRFPRPTAGMKGFEYRVAMTTADLAKTETPAVRVRVAGADTPCEAAPFSTASLDAPLVIRVPAGAPVVPPVPAGFSPAGVIAATDPVRKSKTLKLAAGGILLAGAGAAAAISGSKPVYDPVPPVDAPPGPLAFDLTGFSAQRGAVVSVSTGHVDLRIRVFGGERVPTNFTWRVEFSSGIPVCLVMNGEGSFGAERPANADLIAPLVPTGACTPPFRADLAVLTIVIGGEPVYRLDLRLLLDFAE